MPVPSTILRPKALMPGDTIAIVSPAGPTAEPQAKFAKGKALLEAKGYRVKLMPNAMRQNGYLAGTDAERLADLHAAFADPEVDAILCARGGYGCMRLLPDIDFELIRRHPKLFMGFSDITALLLPMWERSGLVGFYAPMLTSNLVDEEPYTWSEWLRVITGDASLPHAIPNADPYTCLQPGQAEGILMGGNLSLLAALCGTPYQPDTTGAILFIEDWHERYYSLDRQFRQLKLSGLLDNLAGLVLCDFSETDEPETSPTLAEFFAGLIKSLDLNPSIPIGLGYSVGHGAHTATMSIGTRASFDSLSGRVMLLESPVLRPA